MSPAQAAGAGIAHERSAAPLQTPTSSVAAPPLPTPRWTVYQSSSTGLLYYANAATGAVQWEAPPDFDGTYSPEQADVLRRIEAARAAAVAEEAARAAAEDAAARAASAEAEAASVAATAKARRDAQARSAPPVSPAAALLLAAAARYSGSPRSGSGPSSLLSPPHPRFGGAERTGAPTARIALPSSNTARVPAAPRSAQERPPAMSPAGPALSATSRGPGLLGYGVRTSALTLTSPPPKSGASRTGAAASKVAPSPAQRVGTARGELSARASPSSAVAGGPVRSLAASLGAAPAPRANDSASSSVSGAGVAATNVAPSLSSQPLGNSNLDASALSDRHDASDVASATGLYVPDRSNPEDAPVANWVAYESHTPGLPPFYYNAVTGITTWVRPAWLPADHAVVPVER